MRSNHGNHIWSDIFFQPMQSDLRFGNLDERTLLGGVPYSKWLPGCPMDDAGLASHIAARPRLTDFSASLLSNWATVHRCG